MIRISEARNKNSNVITNTDNETIIAQKNANGIVDKLMDMTTVERIHTYVGEFLTEIQYQKYDEAYAKLNETFKANYYSDIETFKTYVQNKYPSNPKVNYHSTTREGEYFVVKVTISDIFDSSFTEFTQRFVVRENEANDYTISFQAE